MILIVFGLPATGKTSFARQLAGELNALYLGTDDVRQSLKLHEVYDARSTELVYDQLLIEMSALIQYKRDLVIEGVFGSDHIRGRILEKAREMEQDVFFVEIRASESTIIERLTSRIGHTESDLKIYYQLKIDADHMEHEHLILDSDEDSIAEMIRKTKKYIYGAD